MTTAEQLPPLPEEINRVKSIYKVFSPDRVEVLLKDYARQAISALEAENKRLRYEYDLYRAKYESAVGILGSIYNLLYPPMFTTSDGIKMAFRPKSLDPHEVLQELSDRIRAVPDQVAAMKEQP